MPETDAVYSEEKIKSVQMESEELKEVISLVSQGGPEAFKQEMGTCKKKSLSTDMQSLLQHADLIQIRKGIVCVKGSSSQPKSLRIFIPEEKIKKYMYMESLHHNMNHMGWNKLSATASKYVLGPRMYQAANSVVSSCATCLQRIDAVRQNSPPSRPTRAMVPWQSLSIDVIHMPLAGGFQYILIVQTMGPPTFGLSLSVTEMRKI
jgi:hypothetical protein